MGIWGIRLRINSFVAKGGGAGKAAVFSGTLNYESSHMYAFNTERIF